MRRNKPCIDIGKDQSRWEQVKGLKVETSSAFWGSEGPITGIQWKEWEWYLTRSEKWASGCHITQGLNGGVRFNNLLTRLVALANFQFSWCAYSPHGWFHAIKSFKSGSQNPENLTIQHEPIWQCKDAGQHLLGRGVGRGGWEPKQDFPCVSCLWFPLRGDEGENSF